MPTVVVKRWIFYSPEPFLAVCALALGCHCSEPLEPSHLTLMRRVREAEQTRPGGILKLWMHLNFPENARRSIERALTVAVWTGLSLGCPSVFYPTWPLFSGNTHKDTPSARGSLGNFLSWVHLLVVLLQALKGASGAATSLTQPELFKSSSHPSALALLSAREAECSENHRLSSFRKGPTGII